MGPVLLATGVVAVVVGTWRGYVNAREALAPMAHPGDPTRTAVETQQSVLDRPRARRFLRSVAASLCWLAVAMYGLFLAAASETAA